MKALQKPPGTFLHIPLSTARSLSVKFHGRQCDASHLHSFSFSLFSFFFIHPGKLPSFFSLCFVIIKLEESSLNEYKTGPGVKETKTHKSELHRVWSPYHKTQKQAALNLEFVDML